MSHSMTRRSFTRAVSSVAAIAAIDGIPATPSMAQTRATGEGALESVAKGRFTPDWNSLRDYKCPDWFRDAKFGIWQHWSAQCVPEQGDWYARNMYQQYQKTKDGTLQPGHDYTYHCEHYGHPSKFGFKDIDRIWNAENWDPVRLAGLYKAAGAKYIVALANHHDNFDCFDSKYQPWNAVAMGPKRDIIGGWAKAVRAEGLRFGVSVHAARAWNWFDVSTGSDVDGPLAGIPYDGVLTKADGKGTWWEGLDPNDLYAQGHNKGAKPDAAYCNKFFNRIIDLINKYEPDLVNFDDDYTPAGLPLYNIDPTIGLRLAAHLYNKNEQRHGGKLEAVLNGKRLSPDHIPAMVYDIEQGTSGNILPLPWQTETCIGNWHYNRSLYERHTYAKSGKVLHMMIDIVSKNGNLLLSIPVRGDGSIDSDEEAILGEIGDWMRINSEAIHGTRPWTVFGEGPTSLSNTTPMREIVYTEKDIRFTTKGSTLYAIVLGWPTEPTLTIKALASGSPHRAEPISSVRLLGTEMALRFHRDGSGLNLTLPSRAQGEAAFVFRIDG